MKTIALIALLLSFSLPASAQKDDDSTTLPGTNTAPVRISLDEKGMPYVDVDPVVVRVGQRVVFVGPEKFIVKFPENTPFEEKMFNTKNAVINLVVPEKAEPDKYYKYEVIVDRQVLDPYIYIKH